MIGHFINEHLWSFVALISSAFGNFLPMFISSCEEVRGRSAQALVPGKYIANERCIRRADMRLGVDVVDGGGEVEGLIRTNQTPIRHALTSGADVPLRHTES